jgi:hypothetical protein
MSEDNKAKDASKSAHAQTVIHQLDHNGTIALLKRQLLARLFLQCPQWLPTMEEALGEVVRYRDGDLVGLTSEDVTDYLMEFGKETIPEDIERIMKAQIQEMLRESTGI